MKIKILFILSLLLVVQVACKRSSDILGPAACPTEGFAVIEPFEFKNNANASTTDLNLVNSYAHVTAKFNEEISYKLTINGETSGAQFVFNGKGDIVDYNWYGNSSNGKYFAKNEVLSYKLTSLCRVEPLGSGQITLISVVGYNGFGVKVANFEETPPVGGGGYGDCFSGVCAASSLVTSASSDYMESPQGENYYKFKASCTTAASGIAWYFGGRGFDGIDFASMGNDPSRVYLNFFAKGKSNSQCQMIIKELSNATLLNRKFLANVSPEQWILYSVKLSDIGVINPSAIASLDMNLGAAVTQDADAEVDLDLIIFTFDKPF